MIDKKQKYFYLSLISGMMFLTTYFLNDYLYDRLWIFYLLPISFFGLTFLMLFIGQIATRNRNGIFIGVLVIGVVLTIELLDSEIFKSKKLLEASLIDDLSSIHLTLRENKKFEVVASTILTEETFKGNYQVLNGKIIFTDKRYSNDFIPDTLTIIGDKIIWHFDKEGKPIVEFASYFDIHRNELKTHYNSKK